jgi:hypothetical protein
VKIAWSRSLVIRSRSAVAIASLVATSVGVWVIAPRFSLQASLVDDWSAIVNSPSKLHDILRLTYHETGRFRPAFEVWNYLQWHSLGAPGSMIGPNVWGIARLFLLVLGLSAFTTLLLSARQTRGGRHAATTVALTALPALVIVSTPEFGVDLARFGPQEPALIGGMTLGGTLLCLGLRRLASDKSQTDVWATGGLLAGGMLFWIYGVYQKEVSVCVVLLVPFVALAGRDWLRRFRLLSHRRQAGLAGCGVLIALPIVHVAYEVLTIAENDQIVYQTHVQVNKNAVGRVDLALRLMHSSIGSAVGWTLLLAVLGGALIAAVRFRPDWMPTGLLVTALATLAWSAQTPYAASRYFMPMIALLAVAFALQLASLPRVPQLVAVAAALTFVAISLSMSRPHLLKWKGMEQQDNGLVSAVSAAYRTGCPVVVTGLDLERAEALPELVKLRIRSVGTCRGPTTYVALGARDPDPALIDICLPQGNSVIGIWTLALERIGLTRCAGVKPSALAVVARDRLR